MALATLSGLFCLLSSVASVSVAQLGGLCEAREVKGFCERKTICTGESVPGTAGCKKDPANVQCCIEAACKVGTHKGFCKTATSCTGTSVKSSDGAEGCRSFPANVQCCHGESGGSGSDSGGDDSATLQVFDYLGKCMLRKPIADLPNKGFMEEKGVLRDAVLQARKLDTETWCTNHEEEVQRSPLYADVKTKFEDSKFMDAVQQAVLAPNEELAQRFYEHEDVITDHHHDHLSMLQQRGSQQQLRPASHPVMEGKFDEDMSLIQLASQTSLPFMPGHRFWKDSSVPYCLGPSLHNILNWDVFTTLLQIQLAITTMQLNTPVTFHIVACNAPGHKVRFRKGNPRSSVGFDAPLHTTPQANLIGAAGAASDQNLYHDSTFAGALPGQVFIVLHEMFHMLGFMHTNQRRDRADCLQPGAYGLHSGGAINCGTQAGPPLGETYDLGSIMHYPPWACKAVAGGGNGIVLQAPLPAKCVPGAAGVGIPAAWSNLDLEAVGAIYSRIGHDAARYN